MRVENNFIFLFQLKSQNMSDQNQQTKSQADENKVPVKVIKERTHIREIRMRSMNSISGTVRTLKTEWPK